MAVAAIRTSKLSKDYGLGHGLFDLDLEVAPQEVFGYLGPNGAGKSTTIRCLMGLIRPTLGSAHIFGLDCQRDSVAVKRKVGYLPGDMPQFGSLRGREVVAYLGGLPRRRRSQESFATSPSASTWTSAAAFASTRAATRRSSASCSPSCTSRTCSSSTSPPAASTP